MTVAAAWYLDAAHYGIATDSIGILGNGRRCPSVKAFRWGPVIVAHAGSAMLAGRAEQRTREAAPPEYAGDLDTALPELFRHVAAVCGPPGSNETPNLDIVFLIASPWGLRMVGGDGGVCDPGRRWAIGSGGDAALGAMAALGAVDAPAYARGDVAPSASFGTAT